MKMWNLLFRNYQGTQDCTGRALNHVWTSSKHDYTGYIPTKPAPCIRKKIFSVFFSFGIWLYETPLPSPVSSPCFLPSSSIFSQEGLLRAECNHKRDWSKNRHLYAKQATITGECKKRVQNPSSSVCFPGNSGGTLFNQHAARMEHHHHAFSPPSSP